MADASDWSFAVLPGPHTEKAPNPELPSSSLIVADIRNADVLYERTGLKPGDRIVIQIAMGDFEMSRQGRFIDGKPVVLRRNLHATIH